MKTIASIISMFLLTSGFMSGGSDNTQTQKESTLKTASQANGFSYVRAHRQGKGVTVTWAATNASDVSFVVEKTYSDPTDIYTDWESVSQTPCDGSRSYKCHDESVFPGYVNYRVGAMGNDGSVVYSETATVRIVSRK